MRNRIYFLLFAILLSTSCNCRKMANKAPERTFISIERTACFGTCPIDVYTLYLNGHQRYEGRKFTDLTGEFTANITAQKSCKLFKEFGKMEWQRYDSVYRSLYSDLPTTIIRYQQGSQQISIELGGEQPDALDSLVAKLSALRDAQIWKATTIQ